jgi:hypothetical protein
VKAVARHRKVFDAGDFRDARDELFDIVAQERFAAGQADFPDALPNGDTNGTFNFFKREDFVLRHPLLDNGRRVGEVRPVTAIEILRRLRLRKAIQATEVAAVGKAYPQVAQNPTLRIHERAGLGHGCGGALVAVGALVPVKGGMTRTEPSASTSTFRS